MPVKQDLDGIPAKVTFGLPQLQLGPSAPLTNSTKLYDNRLMARGSSLMQKMNSKEPASGEDDDERRDNATPARRPLPR
jgi:hypothetical protein